MVLDVKSPVKDVCVPELKQTSAQGTQEILEATAPQGRALGLAKFTHGLGVSALQSNLLLPLPAAEKV